jgi:cell division septal protein FtsQ
MKSKIWKSLQVITLVVAIGLLGGVAFTTVEYLQTSSRFEVKKVLVLGGKRVAETQVLTQADVPDKANVFSVDLAAIRERVERMPWVRHAIVQRVFPDTVTIKIIEREPVGLARIRGKVYQFDTDAAVLEYDPSTGVNYPILDGLQPKDRSGDLRRVELYSRVLKELQNQDQVSEIHINEADEVSLVLADEPLLIKLGVGDFHSRWIRYLEWKPQIQQHPETSEVDLRFKDQVILTPRTEVHDDEEKVIWDVAKKSL